MDEGGGGRGGGRGIGGGGGGGGIIIKKMNVGAFGAAGYLRDVLNGGRRGKFRKQM